MVVVYIELTINNLQKKDIPKVGEMRDEAYLQII